MNYLCNNNNKTILFIIKITCNQHITLLHHKNAHKLDVLETII